MKARLVSIEGIRASGKSGLAAWLAERVRSQGLEVVVTKEPGGLDGDVTGTAIRSLLLDRSHQLGPVAETFGFEFDRARTYEQLVRPALGRGAWVVSDRHHFGTIAYQGFGRGMDVAWIDQMSARAVGGRYPDLVLLLDMSVEESLRRRALRVRDDRFDRTDRAFEERVRNGFRWAAERYSERCIRIDAERVIDLVHADAFAAVSQLLARQD